MGKWEISHVLLKITHDLTAVTLLILEISQVYRVISKEGLSPTLRAEPMAHVLCFM